MKKSMKLVVFILCVALCAVIYSCASTPKGPSVVAGSWEWVPKPATPGGDTSFCELAVTEEVIDGRTVSVYNLSGTVTMSIQYGLSECDIVPDIPTMDALKTCESISFKIIGDGKTYTIEAPLPTVTDWAFHTFNIYTEPGKVQDVLLPVAAFMQPSWTNTLVDFEQNLLEKLIFKTKNNAEGGEGEWSVKIWDLALHVPAPAKGTKQAAPAAEVGNLGTFTHRLEDNFQYGDGYQGNITARNLLGGHRIEPDETYTLKMTFTTSRDLEDVLQFGFVDTTPAAAYWKLLSADDTGAPEMVKIPDVIKQGDVVSGTYTLRTIARATASSGPANALVFTTEGAGIKGRGGSGVKKSVTLNFTEFVLTRVE